MEQNYEILDCELLAIYVAFREWQHYLKGAQYKIQVLTDHKDLE